MHACPSRACAQSTGWGTEKGEPADATAAGGAPPAAAATLLRVKVELLVDGAGWDATRLQDVQQAVRIMCSDASTSEWVGVLTRVHRSTELRLVRLQSVHVATTSQGAAGELQPWGLPCWSHVLRRSLHRAWQLIGDALRMLDAPPDMLNLDMNLDINLDTGSERERRADCSRGDGEAAGEGHDVSAESLLVCVMLQVCAP